MIHTQHNLISVPLPLPCHPASQEPSWLFYLIVIFMIITVPLGFYSFLIWSLCRWFFHYDMSQYKFLFSYSVWDSHSLDSLVCYLSSVLAFISSLVASAHFSISFPYQMHISPHCIVQLFNLFSMFSVFLPA